MTTWSYNPYRAQLRRNGEAFAIVSPDMRDPLSEVQAADLVAALNYWEIARNRHAFVMAGRARAVASEAERGNKIDAFTCDSCPQMLGCEFAFDSYNTNGDCLAEK